MLQLKINLKKILKCLSVISNSLDPMDYRLHGILQARILERVAFPSRGRSPGDLPKPGIDPMSPTLQADSLPSEPREAQEYWSG